MHSTANQTAQPTPGPWQREGAFLYALNVKGVNRFSCQIQGGFTDDDTRTTREELEAIGRLFHAAPALLAALTHIWEVYAKQLKLNDTIMIERAIARAEGGQP